MQIKATYHHVQFFFVFVLIQFVICPLHILRAVFTGRASPLACTGSICQFLGIKFFKTSKSHTLDLGALFLCNHRSWADFFIDQFISGGATYLSRYMVIFACPFSSLYAWMVHSVTYFHRKKGVNRSTLGAMIVKQWETKRDNGLIVYPEGTRNQLLKPLKLKTGKNLTVRRL